MCIVCTFAVLWEKPKADFHWGEQQSQSNLIQKKNKQKKHWGSASIHRIQQDNIILLPCYHKPSQTRFRNNNRGRTFRKNRSRATFLNLTLKVFVTVLFCDLSFIYPCMIIHLLCSVTFIQFSDRCAIIQIRSNKWTPQLTTILDSELCFFFSNSKGWRRLQLISVRVKQPLPFVTAYITSLITIPGIWFTVCTI